MVWTKVTVSSYMYYYTVNLSPSIIIRDAVIIWAVMQQTKRDTFMHTCPVIFFFCLFLKSSFQLITGILSVFSGPLVRSLQVIVDHCRSLQVIVGHCRSLQVIPCFSNYVKIIRLKLNFKTQLTKALIFILTKRYLPC